MPLRRIRPEDRSQEWRPRKSVRLYFDDLDEILAAMRQIDDEVRVRAGAFVGTIAKAEDLNEAGPGNLKPLELAAGSEDRAIAVRLSRPVAVRIARRDDYQLAGAGQAIHDLLNRCHTRAGGWSFGGLPSGSAPAETDDFVTRLTMPAAAASALLGTATAATIGGAVAFIESGEDVPPFLAPFIVLATVFAALYSVYKLFLGPNRAPSARIVLAYRADAPTWWERNRTPLLISLTTNVVVAAIFFVLGRWLA